MCINTDHGYSKECFMKLPDIFLEVVLRLIVDPLLEVVEVEYIRVTDLPSVQPFHKEREVVTYFFPVENSVNHVATEQSQLYFVPCVRVNLFVFMN